MNLLTTQWRAALGVAALGLFGAVGASAQRQVTLRLNTSTLPDTTKISEPIEVRGCLVGCTGDQSTLPGGQVIAWNANTTLKPANIGGSYWQIVFQIPDGVAMNFKFFSPQAERATNATPRGSGIGGWEDNNTNAGGNHTIAAGTGPVTLTAGGFGHFFNKTGSDRAYDWRPYTVRQPDSVAVRFRVYMATTEGLNKGFNPTANPQVGVRGDALTAGPLDWGATKVVLSREATDNTRPGYYLYSGTAYYAKRLAGQTQPYKFVFNTPTGAAFEDGTLTGNRTFKVPAADTTLQWAFFGNTPARNLGGPTATATVTFTTDVNPLQRVGLFDLTRGDSIQVRGAFNGWDCAGVGAPDDCLMRKRPIGLLHDLQYTFVNTAVGGVQEYKYFINFRKDRFLADFGVAAPEGWEEDINTTGINRTLAFAGTAQSTGTQFFNGIVAANIIPAGTSVNTTFRVNLKNGLLNSGQPFNAASDSVFVQFEDPIFEFVNGINEVNGAPDRRFRMTRVGTTGTLYEGTFPIRGVARNGKALGTYSGISYKYTYGKAGAFFTEPGVGTSTLGRRRVRFIVPTAADGSTWPASYSLISGGRYEVMQVEAGPLEYECNPAAEAAPFRAPRCLASGQTVTSVERDVNAGIPTEALVSSVAPNPVRGTARFSYGVPSSARVDLSVYDMLGREVARLVEGEQAAGTYDVTFDTAELAAGVYVYRLTVGGRTSARTMVVAK